MKIFKQFSPLYRMLTLFLTANVLSFSLQLASLKPYSISVLYWVNNHVAMYSVSTAILFFILLGLDALFNNVYFAIAASTSIVGSLVYSQYHKLKILGEPIYPWDLNQIQNFGEMLRIARNIVSPALIITLIIVAVALLAATFWIPRKRLKLPLRVAYIFFAIFAVYFSTHLNSHIFAKPMQKMGVVNYPWNQKENYKANGFVVAFLQNIGAKIEVEPVGYSDAAVKSIVQKYQGSGQAAELSDDQKPNIVYVMDEALFDPTRLPKITYSEDPMKNFHAFQGTYATGWSLSPVFGGGTSNAEFEALTGLNMSFVNEGAVPYQQLLTKKDSFPSIVSLLKDRGYQATAVHPFDKTFYNRNRVYPVLGFEKFISQDDIKYKEALSDHGFISDMSAVKQVLDVLNEGDKPHFVHLVTMQNHFPVIEGNNGPNTISITGLEAGTGKVELESYAQSVKETDKAIKYLVDSIQSVKRPTIILMFGDHLPALQQATYDVNFGTLPAEQKQRIMHETPLLVAANYPLQEKSLGTLAPSFFGPLMFQLTGQPLPPYYQLLEDVRKQMPGVSPNVYVDAQNTPTIALNAEQKKVLHDYEMIQYDLFYGKGYAKELFK